MVSKPLKRVQALMNDGDDRAKRIYQTIGVYLGYGVAHFADFYDLQHVLGVDHIGPLRSPHHYATRSCMSEATAFEPLPSGRIISSRETTS